MNLHDEQIKQVFAECDKLKKSMAIKEGIAILLFSIAVLGALGILPLIFVGIFAKLWLPLLFDGILSVVYRIASGFVFKLADKDEMKYVKQRKKYFDIKNEEAELNKVFEASVVKTEVAKDNKTLVEKCLAKNKKVDKKLEDSAKFAKSAEYYNREINGLGL